MRSPAPPVRARTAAPARRFTVNGRPVEVAVPGGRRLLDVLRLDLGLTGSKEGCGEGECGACSVLLDGEVVDSCLVPVCQVEGREVRTVEGLAIDGALDPLQAAILETGGVQCGICTPGMLMAARAFLDSAGARDAADPPDDMAIRGAIAGNLCRCTGYGRIVEAIRLAAVGRSAGCPPRAPPRPGPQGRPPRPAWPSIGRSSTSTIPRPIRRDPWPRRTRSSRRAAAGPSRAARTL